LLFCFVVCVAPVTRRGKRQQFGPTDLSIKLMEIVEHVLISIQIMPNNNNNNKNEQYKNTLLTIRSTMFTLFTVIATVILRYTEFYSSLKDKL